MKTVDIFGPFTGPTGYDNLVRGFAQGLAKSSVDVALFNFDRWSGFRIDYPKQFDELAKKRPVGMSRVMLNFCLPPQAQYGENQFNAVYTMFEGTCVNETWAKAASTMDLVIVPTESSKVAFTEKGVRPSLIKKVPIGIDVGKFKPDVTPATVFDENYKELSRYPIRVMNMQELGPRKNIEGLLRAWMIGTSSGFMKSHSCLMLKLSAYSPNRYSKLLGKLDALRKELGFSKSDHAPIMVSCRMYTDTDLPHYMACATHYLSMSRAEGWDLPAMQAAALGKILLVPFHSSYKEWVNENLVEVVKEYDEVDAVAEDAALSDVYQSSKWFAPNVEVFAKKIGNLHNSFESDQADALSFAEEVGKRYSWEVVSDQLLQILDEEAFEHRPGDPKQDLAEAYNAEERKYPDEADMPHVICQWCKNIGKQCGIANYTARLVEEIMRQKGNIGYVGGDCRAHDMLVSNNKYGVENIQLEYQFAAPNRLAYMLQSLRERGVKSVVTMHTFSEQAAAHNIAAFRFADQIFVHSETVKTKMTEAFLPTSKVRVVKMAAPPLMSPEERKTIDCSVLPKGRFKIGYYGFLYFHKGVEKLVHAFAKVKKEIPEAFLVLHACKPQNTEDDVSGRVLRAMEQHGLVASKDYVWYSQYEENERKAIAILSQCDLNVLPYDHYGSYGTSAAIGSVLSAGKPVLVSNVCWFDHVPTAAAWRYEPSANKQEDIENLSKGIINAKRSIDDDFYYHEWIGAVRNYVEEHSITEVASQHLEAYREISGIDFRN